MLLLDNNFRLRDRIKMAREFNKSRNDTEGSSVDELPNPEKELPEIVVYSHSTLFYWWPVWVSGFLLALVTFFKGGVVELDQVRNEYFHTSSSLGMIYVLVLLLVITFTNIKIRGIYSLSLILAFAFITVTFAWLGFWDDIFTFIPQLSIHMNMGFYLVFSTLLLILWLMMFFVFDRMVYWRIRPGQIIEEKIIGGGQESYDTRGMLFEQRSDDFFRHTVLGLGAGDLCLITSGAKEETIEIPNVLFAERKVKAIQKLVAVEPNQLMTKS